ncbi:histidine kinase [Mucilaginibacter sp. HME9299]|uniref:histidine kinase n=2 Tax=Mucilaginibacter aquatilis TaxID=1517760 RepID=A0A6I4ICZ9_9SPHI|nr:histidine kinase [Mucilaginibacter aquatilis]
MSFLTYLSIFLLFNWLNRAVKMTQLSFKWKAVLGIGQGAAAVAYFVLKKPLSDEVHLLIGSIALGAIIKYFNEQEDFKSFRSYFESHYPLIAVGILIFLISIVVPSFYDEYDQYFLLPLVAAFIWVISRWAASKKQREELLLYKAKNEELDRLVAERTAEIQNQKEELEATIELLQNTQQQLIQSEKLASLGELTAGIAHEIQNPLNFVNNFAEVSSELLVEMTQELAKGDLEEVRYIADDIRQNLEKISQHGKRADSIVKGMLQHSRTSNGQKEPVNVNNLADEYMRLAYHGLRAKDKSFNSELVTNFDNSLPEVNIIQQDVGRVLLNLFTNAFYAVHQKQKELGQTFRPKIEVSTRLQHNNIELTVKDNGTGIPEAIRDKIMQPFFTTKPTGEGTGLGLSLSYDIIVKGHNGNIAIESEEGNGSVFIITLPII